MKLNKSMIAEQSPKKIFLFDMTFSLISSDGLLQTQRLERKLTHFFQKEQKNVSVKVYDSSQIDKEAKRADILLLTSLLGYAKDKIESQFPEIPVFVISKEEYGTLDVEKIVSKMDD
ncbi:hypothetical protein [Enterococcus lactis]|uniref:hypothetical protein n=1 Tax=Enterococcus lactis TaxID=357441 RepID=UPI0022E46B12|nr:hypothetical protein [Enterococcus lactis]